MVSVRSLSSPNATTPSAKIAAAKASRRIGAYLIMRSPCRNHEATKARRSTKKNKTSSSCVFGTSCFRGPGTASQGAFMRSARYALAAALLVAPLVAQEVQPTNDAPNPYNTVKDYFKLPEGRAWGSTSAVEIERTDDRSGSPSA